MDMNKKTQKKNPDFDYKLGFAMPERAIHKTKVGLNRNIVTEIGTIKNEPQWMREFRLRAYDIFMRKPMPRFGPDLSKINFNAISYYIKAAEKSRAWEDLPQEIKETY